MSKNKDVTILILATNEQEILLYTVKTIIRENSKFICKIIIITPQNVTSGCLKMINFIKSNFSNIVEHQTQPKKMPGYGGASIFGISLVKSKFFILCDADGETDPKKINEMINTIYSNEYDIVSCSRWLSSKWIHEYGILNSFFNLVFQFITSILYSAQLTDYTVNFRIYRTESIKKIKFKNFNQSFALESILIPLRKGFKIIEIKYVFKKEEKVFLGIAF